MRFKNSIFRFLKVQITRSAFLSSQIIGVAGLLILNLAWNSIGQTRYFKERNLSAVTTAVVNNIRSIIAAGAVKGRHLTRFIKIGDSITASNNESHTTPNSKFLCQFVCPDYTSLSKSWDFTRNLDIFKSVLSPALLYFLADTLQNGVSSFNRPSAAAKVSMNADWATSDNPSPVRREIDTMSPQFAVIMYGANDASGYGTMYNVLDSYMHSMKKIVDTCILSGVVPILTATCPRLDKLEITLAMSHLVRCLAQQYQVPFIDYHRAMMPLPSYGLGDDGVHPNSFDYNKVCWLTTEGLKNGYNMRNLLTLQMLDKMYRIATTSVTSIDAETPVLAGTGTSSDPYIIDSIAFVDAQATTALKPAAYYKIVVADTLALRALVTYQGTTDINISILDNYFTSIFTATTEPLLDCNIASGTYYIKLTTNGTNYGQYQFVLMDRNNTGMPTSSIDFVSKVPSTPPAISQMKITVTEQFVHLCAPGPGSFAMYTMQGKILTHASLTSPVNTGFFLTAPAHGAYIVKYAGPDIFDVKTIIVR